MIAQTVASTLNALSLSRVASSGDPNAASFLQLFKGLVSDFEQRASKRGEELGLIKP